MFLYSMYKNVKTSISFFETWTRIQIFLCFIFWFLTHGRRHHSPAHIFDTVCC